MDHPSKVFGRVADSEASDDLSSVKKKQRRDHLRSHVMKPHPDKRGDATPTGEEAGDNFNHQDERDNQTGEGASGGREEGPRKLECVVCGQDTFPDLGALRRHYKGHKRKYICRFCGVELGSVGNLMRHNLLHTGVKPFECQKCHLRFSRKDVLKAHLGAHENDNVKRALSRRFGCSKCPARYTSRYSLTRHVRQCHQQNKILKRRRGPGQWRIPQQAEHQQQQSAEENGNRYPIDPDNPLKCTHCQKMFPTTKSLSKHLWYHNQERRFTCQVCQWGFKYATDLNRHVAMHSAGRNLSLAQNRLALAARQLPIDRSSTIVNAQRKYPCDYCTRIFNHRSNRSRHVRRFHSDKLGQGQSQTGTVQQRKEPRSGVQQLTVKDRVRRAGISMAFHRRRVQPVSSIQQKGNGTSDLMKAQQMQIRANDAAEEVQANYNGMYKCELCGKEFAKRLAYKMHLRTHNKQFTCGVCGLKTATQGDLTMHIRTHTGERPFQCSYPNCQWKFARKGQLTAHYLLHGSQSKVKRQYNPKRITPNLIQGSVAGSGSSPHEGQSSRNSRSILLSNLPFKSVPRNADVKMMDTKEQKPSPPRAETKKILPPPPPLIRYSLSAVPMVTVTKCNVPGPSPILVRRPVFKPVSNNSTVKQRTVVACQRCGELFGCRHDLTVHTLVAHSTVGTQDRDDVEWDINGEDINICGDAADLLLPEVVITEEEDDLRIIPVVSASATTTTALADHKEPIYPCTLTGCEKRFKLKYDLIRHMCRHLQESPPPHACPEPGCEARFYHESDLNRHLQKMHNNRKESPCHPCQHCAARFTKPDLLVNHMKSNHPGQDISPLLLLLIWLEQKREDEERQMQEFLANLPPEDEEEEGAVLEADQVEPGFRQEHDMDYSFTLQQMEIDAFDNEDELVSRESQSPKQWSTKCIRKTQSPKPPPQSQAPSTSNTEMMEKLPNENGALEAGVPITCETCNKVFYNRQKFVFHRNYHLREYSYSCPEPGCGEKFKMKGHVDRHIRIYHNSERPVQCVLHCPVPQCNRKFVRNCDFTNHVEKMHPTQNVVASTSPQAESQTHYDDETIQNMLELNEDGDAEEMEPEGTLEDENPEKRTTSSVGSSVKGKSFFGDKGQLPVHQYQCQFCPKNFHIKKSLDTHRRRHHSHLLNLIACQICRAKFQAVEHLESHMKSHRLT